MASHDFNGNLSFYEILTLDLLTKKCSLILEENLVIENIYFGQH